MNEMASPIRPPGPPIELAADVPVSRAVAVLQRLEIPLRYPTDPIWAQLNAGAIPDITRAVWSANGLRAGLLSESQWDGFLNTLPETFGIQRSTLSATSLPVAVRTSPRLGEPIYVDLTIPPRAVRDAVARGGRMKLLAKIETVETTAGAMRFIELTPHHYLPGNNLPHIVREGESFKVTPRSSQERSLDGQTYGDLTLRVELPPGQLLVIGLYWPWSDPTVVNYAQLSSQAEPDPELTTADEAAEPVIEPIITSVDDLPNYAPPPPIKFHIGRALFTGAREGRALQMLLVIGLE